MSGSDDEDGVRDGVSPTEEDMLNVDAEKCPDERFREEGDDPRFVGQAKPTSEQNADAPGDAIGAHAETLCMVLAGHSNAILQFFIATILPHLSC